MTLNVSPTILFKTKYYFFLKPFGDPKKHRTKFENWSSFSHVIISFSHVIINQTIIEFIFDIVFIFSQGIIEKILFFFSKYYSFYTIYILQHKIWKLVFFFSRHYLENIIDNLFFLSSYYVHHLDNIFIEIIAFKVFVKFSHTHTIIIFWLLFFILLLSLFQCYDIF